MCLHHRRAGRSCPSAAPRCVVTAGRYKAGGRAFLVNGGSGNNITNNLIMQSGVGIYNCALDDMVTPLALYDNGKCCTAVKHFLHSAPKEPPEETRLDPPPYGMAGTLKRGDKGDYIWKTYSALGVHNLHGLDGTLLAKRFPSFARMMAINSTAVSPQSS